jgi:putative transposase
MSKNPFRYFKTSPEIIQLGVLMYVRFPLSLRNVEDLLHERGIDVCHESVRLWVDRFGTYFAEKIRKRRSEAMRRVKQWRWHLDEVFVKIRGETHYLWRAVDREGEILEVYVTKKRDNAEALKFLGKAMKRMEVPKSRLLTSARPITQR